MIHHSLTRHVISSLQAIKARYGGAEEVEEVTPSWFGGPTALRVRTLTALDNGQHKTNDISEIYREIQILED